MDNVYFQERDFAEPKYNFGTKIHMSGLGLLVDEDVKITVNLFVEKGFIVVLKDGKYTYGSVKEFMPDIETLTEWPKAYILIEVDRYPWPG